MSYSKPLPPFIFDVLCYLNRDELEQFSIVCRPLRNLIMRYFHAKPYRVFDQLLIHGGLYALYRNGVQWHPIKDRCSVKQLLGKKRRYKVPRCNSDRDNGIDESRRTHDNNTYYSFSEMRPYLGPTIRIKWTTIDVAGDSTFNPDHIKEMESIAYLWRDSNISIGRIQGYGRIGANTFQPILNSQTILQCRYLIMYNAHFLFTQADFSFKDYKVLYAVKVIETWYDNREFDFNCWMEFLEQPGIEPIVILSGSRQECITNILDRLCKAFSAAILRNAFKIIFVPFSTSLTEFCKMNNISGEKLELKKGLSMEYKRDLNEKTSYTLERSSI